MSGSANPACIAARKSLRTHWKPLGNEGGCINGIPRKPWVRRGVKRASIAVAHSLLGVCYYLIRDHERVYEDLGAEHFSRAVEPQKEAASLVKRLERLGYKVAIQRPAA